MKNLLQESFRLNLFILKIIGLYPTKKQKLYKIYSYTNYIFVTILLTTSATVAIIFTDMDLSEISNNAFMVSQLWALLFKLWPFVRYSNDVKKNLETLKNPHFNGYSNQQENIIEKCIRISRRNYLLFFSSCLVTLFSWASKPFFTGHNILPMDVWMPFDLTNETKTYFSAYVIIVVGVSYGAISNASVDTLITGLMCHATGQIAILKDSLIYLEDYVEHQLQSESKMSHKEKEIIKPKMIYERITECVEHYRAIMKFVKDIEKTYMLTITGQFFVSALVICVSCYQLTIVEPLSFPFFAMVNFISTVLAEIFLYCYYGTTLYEESNTVITAISMSTWYNYDLKSQRALIILMECSQKPLSISAAKIFDCSLETFTMILRRAYSFFAILRNY